MSNKNCKINCILFILIIILFIYPNNSFVLNLIAKNNISSLSNKSIEKNKEQSNSKSEDKIWDKLRGSWRKVSFKEKINGEFVDFDWHIGGELYLIYDGFGGCAIISQSKNYSESFNNFDNQNIETKDLIKKSDSYYYFASCKINNDTIEHTKLLHSNPNEVGDIAKRKFKIISNGLNKMLDTLILIPLNFDNYAELKLVRVD